MSAHSNVRPARSVVVVTLILGVVIGFMSLGSGSIASAARAGNKDKPTPTATAPVTPVPTSTATATVNPDPGVVQLSCIKSNGYVVATYSSGDGTIYHGAVLSAAGIDALATFGSTTRTKFPLSMLPQGVIVKVNMVATDGSVVASCDVNTGYSDPR